MLPLLSECWAREKPNAIASPSATPLSTMVGLCKSKLNAEHADKQRRTSRHFFGHWIKLLGVTEF